ncbi:Sterigmatocystin 8-O-methyltransferase [Fusarium odoratissimum]|uniref:Sterigmatocystin 8-O-methyltransferase n=2 Tax=Fusarium oxysporum species complex TaxID=171631 RepID=N1S8L8_FUSC4|nr:Sterigmatocystin 8-O-methyltransferase [Fusarium odoratissimum]ENH73543.1 Sterigmatocystin 8-O-methyltransferase [Fusarium oxysporum f. sp. cubense race 1]
MRTSALIWPAYTPIFTAPATQLGLMPSENNLIEALQGLDDKSFNNEAGRLRALEALTLAVSKIQRPWDIVWQHCWVNPATTACTKTLIDAGIFTKWVEAGGGDKTCAELAELTKTDPVLIRRLIRQISGQNLVIETAEDTYKPTPWVKALAADQALANVYGGLYHFVNVPMFRRLPEYLKQVGYRNLTDPYNCNWQFVNGSKENVFESLVANPVASREFNDAMESHSKYNLTPWPEIYPTGTLLANYKLDRPLVVDVGGSKGHDLIKFHIRHPGTPAGSLVLQDLPGILRELDIPDTISVKSHDFFTPQPVRGARAYFMHNILHDWEDNKASQILKHIADAMEPGYSRLLIHESIINSIKPLARVTTSDITMMACLGAKERTENEWRQLVQSVGLNVLKIWGPFESMEGIIETELA